MLAGPGLPDRAIGLVALTGKVVEHAAGYRAQYARAVALAISWGGSVFLGDDPQWIEAVFAGEDPAVPGSARRLATFPRPLGEMRGFFERAERRCREAWTSARSGE